MKYLCLFLLCFFIQTSLSAAHIRGKLTDNQGEALSFASIYVRGTSTGTTSNIEGFYDLVLEAGNYELVFQYVGYESKTETVTIGQKDIQLDIVLNPIANNIQEVVVTAGEDPAYRIIRKAIKKRKFYLNQVKKYSCDSYVKGTQHIRNLPKTFMGQSLDMFRQGLDSNGTGIIYLSESVSRLHYKEGTYKEIMSSSKVSGDDNGFSFNSGAALASLSFYENTFELGDTKILSPIASGALAAYKYRLETSFFDNEGHLVYKIEVIPKNKLGAVFAGYIYIVDEDWAIHSTDLFTTGKSVNISVLDTVHFKQTHLKLNDGIWRIFSQDIDFTLKLLVIGTQGNFIGVFSNYDLNPTFDPKFFNAEIFKVEDLANKKLSAYWDSIRPVPLSQQETVEYHTKDSLQKVWDSKAYKDSMDRVSNQPKIFDLITGYTFRNSHRQYRFTILSPIHTLHFNTVQGQIIGLGLEFIKDINEEKQRWFKLHAEGEYSFDDRQFRGFGYFQMRFNALNNAFLHIEGGRYKRQFNPSDPVPLLVNTYYSLLAKLNYMKLYDEYYGRVYYSQQIVNGLLFKGSIKYAHRVALTNNAEASWFPKNPNRHFSNHPKDLGYPHRMKDAPSFLAHQHLEIVLALRLRFGQKYITYPNRRFYTSSKFPDIWIRYKRGIPLLGASTNYDYLELKIEKDEIPIGTVGLLSFKATGGWFPSSSKMYFIDYHHFNGNQTIIAKTSEYLSTFQLLPYYERSTNSFFGMLHIQHDFNGFIWNKIPGLKTLGFEFVTGYHLLYTPEQGEYMEFNIGLDRIGWNLFRFLRVDFVMGYQIGEPLRYGGVIGLTISL
ncbi:DUF5686 and carboxypeptidase regulatory-like domain-containing protein [Aureispira anguillae]|uniref:DUF5686 and carboxypeptidase regulatory-like domain-containing protein n=1 Tax=Aureispira anguillae TaxID=2864201 RepID=A0A915YI44_9BACT|nr:DUF5686 and carboxypeptidase regulatory-like domain-containing protein [Aureispira anguillae]BDS13429.1 DUF5686 and carboxypeptidase regulatory-like domain-containing protein [Aureispira anguillae]